MASSRKWVPSWSIKQFPKVAPCADIILAMVQGGTVSEDTQLNIESLWSGGAFQDPVCLIPP